jgi:hypothetical protein
MVESSVSTTTEGGDEIRGNPAFKISAFVFQIVEDIYSSDPLS